VLLDGWDGCLAHQQVLGRHDFHHRYLQREAGREVQQADVAADVVHVADFVHADASPDDGAKLKPGVHVRSRKVVRRNTGKPVLLARHNLGQRLREQLRETGVDPVGDQQFHSREDLLRFVPTVATVRGGFGRVVRCGDVGRVDRPVDVENLDDHPAVAAETGRAQRPDVVGLDCTKVQFNSRNSADKSSHDDDEREERADFVEESAHQQLLGIVDQ
jgi:hypothetical protein